MRKVSVGVVLLALTSAVASAVQTPEQRADPGTGQIPNADALEYYGGTVSLNQSITGYIQGAVYPYQASLTWYKYISDGVTPVSFDLFGSNMGFNVGGFGGSNFGELAVYDSNGRFVGGNQGARTPADGDSKVAITIPEGAPPPPGPDFSQPLDPTSATYHYSSNWYHDNDQGLPKLDFVNAAQPAPTWNASNPDHGGTVGSIPNSVADWGEYKVLAPGEYFIAVTGYSTYFAGDPHDITDAGTDTANPFGFVTYHAMTGTYQLNVRRLGDLDQSGAVNSSDLALLIQKIQDLAPSSGIPLDTSSGTWVGMPAELQVFDLTANDRIDKYDLRTFERYTGIFMTRTPVNVATLNGSGSITIDGQAYTVSSGGNFSGTLQDVVLPGNLVLTGGTLVLSGNNSWSGGTSVTGGILSIGSEANLGDLYSDVTLNGGTLRVTGTAYTNTYRTFSIGPAGGTIEIADPNNTLTVTSTLTTAGTLTKSGPGILALGASLNTVSPLSISGGTLQFNLTTSSAVAAISGAGNLAVNSGAALTSDAITLHTLTIGGSVQIRANGNSTSQLSALVLAGGTDNWTGGLDLTNNKLIINDGSISRSSTIATLQNQVKYGKTHSNAGLFTSSVLPANVTLAVLDNAVLNKLTFGGIGVDASSILIAPELVGDANADGKVDLTDLSTVLNHFGAQTSAWTSGNFDGGATINLTDLSDVLNNFGLTYAGAAAGPAVAVAPEPASVAFLLFAIPLAFRRSTSNNRSRLC
ncbi:MAG: dockerin type I domain-containing protein [Phycisphaerae bacterium]